MLPYQNKYAENAAEIALLGDFYGIRAEDFSEWYEKHLRADERAAKLRDENIALLNACLFPALDALYGASEAEIAALEEFADRLMDWSANLDCGIYVLIYEALLSLYRVRKDRSKVLKCLYKLGMGLYYQSRSVQGIDRMRTQSLYFRNELVFTEAGSYLKFFSDIDDEEAKGYIIRSLANIAICSRDLHRRIAVSARVLNIVQDDYYRSLAPSLPWDVFLRKTYQQMSANRSVLSKGDLSTQELASVLDACHYVFEPETLSQEPNVRWLWPYYEMEYSCGFVDLPVTLERMEHLIEQTDYDRYDISGLYANVQLPIYYGHLLRDNPSVARRPRYVRFLADAYRKMMRTLMTIPASCFNDFFRYSVTLVITDYYEAPGVESYLEITTRLMERLCGTLHIRSQKVGRVLRLLCAELYRTDPTFFDDIEFLRTIADPAEKRDRLLRYAGQCGLYHDFGLIKMNFERLGRTRALLEDEFQVYQLHTVSGYDDLVRRRSTESLADIALGHHSWYNGTGGYPADYIRTQSQYRQMTDAAAIAAYLVENGDQPPDVLFRSVLRQVRSRFSPPAASPLNDPQFCKQLAAILQSSNESYYRSVYERLRQIEPNLP